MAQPRVLYEDGRPYTVPDSLEELTGPTSGVVWHQLWLPRKVRVLCESRFRSLASVA